MKPINPTELQNAGINPVNNIQFSDIFMHIEIQSMQDLFSIATGVASLVTLPDGTPVTKPSNFGELFEYITNHTEAGLVNCFKSVSEADNYGLESSIIHPCMGGGLLEAKATIIIGNRHIANWHIGQVRNEVIDEECMNLYADKIGINRNRFMTAFKKVPVMPLEQFGKVSELLFAFTKEISEKANNNLNLNLQINELEDSTIHLQESEERFRNLLHDVKSVSVQGYAPA